MEDLPRRTTFIGWPFTTGLRFFSRSWCSSLASVSDPASVGGRDERLRDETSTDEPRSNERGFPFAGTAIALIGLLWNLVAADIVAHRSRGRFSQFENFGRGSVWENEPGRVCPLGVLGHARGDRFQLVFAISLKGQPLGVPLAFDRIAECRFRHQCSAPHWASGRISRTELRSCYSGLGHVHFRTLAFPHHGVRKNVGGVSRNGNDSGT